MTGAPAAPEHRSAPGNARKADYELGQDNIQLFGLDIHNPVFVVPSLTVIGFVAGVLVFQEDAAATFGMLRSWLTSTFDWVLMAAANLFLLFCLLLLVTPLGRVRLGGPHARPDYSAGAWFAMLFAAGVGIGLMFFGVAEPVEHFLQPPLGSDGTDAAAAQRIGIAATIFHWGVHGWAIYAVVALALAFASYNLGLPLTLRSAFYPLLGDAIWGAGVTSSTPSPSSPRSSGWPPRSVWAPNRRRPDWPICSACCLPPPPRCC